MKTINYFFLLFLLSNTLNAQVDKNDEYLNQPDTIKVVQLDEVLILKGEIDEESKKNFLILQRRVQRVYPYAKATAERLVALEKGMAKLKTEKEKKKYFKIVEKYLVNEFEGQLKKLSSRDGQILVKLIHRQTGSTTFDLIKEQKSGWKAFWANKTARVFSINLKAQYNPYNVPEDFLIETILVRAFEEGRLPKQNPGININYQELAKSWNEKVAKSKT
ncbi:MAG: DUF4294 domain-containing protein [Flavobacterium lindanitolerans]|jgi:hypothetical protein|uniref:DUF4294 domain-containing protein n=1 Tax=Flavobacterium TaxID=237 RepID=UPI000965D210|nr:MULTISPECIES: DUF4294 domain-containing protein [Flavobacterium]MBL7868463.1 DUF4294 domain-containing protein [Flavobacterium lindanitolerans]OJX53932.1 MAG: hypothetical protein BGO88_09670 [Flavobacterium sp. 38-13]THD33557.1 MAG: DUF4294 domain-containing protein [Flavobacterium johnsoniae]